jgi:hypothetical protein
MPFQKLQRQILEAITIIMLTAGCGHTDKIAQYQKKSKVTFNYFVIQ